jgi:hypothetical protein
MRRRFAILFFAAAFASIFGTAACSGGAKEEPVQNQQERQTKRGPVQEPEPPEPTQVKEPTTDRTVGKNIYG